MYLYARLRIFKLTDFGLNDRFKIIYSNFGVKINLLKTDKMLIV